MIHKDVMQRQIAELKMRVRSLEKERLNVLKICGQIHEKLDRIEPLLKFQVMMAGRQNGRQAQARKIVDAMIRRSNRRNKRRKSK